MKRNKNNQIEGNLVRTIQNSFHNSDDLQCKVINVGAIDCTLIFLEDIINKNLVQENIIAPILKLKKQHSEGSVANVTSLEDILPAESITILEEMSEIKTHLLDGFTLLCINDQQKNGPQKIYAANTTEFALRSPDEPLNEPTISGPRDGFIESIHKNIALLRMHLRTQDLVLKKYEVGSKVKTYVYVAYIKYKANDKLINDVKSRIEGVGKEYISDSNVLQQFLDQNTHSVFPELKSTQHPVRVADDLIEGRVAILSEGSPTALIAPTTLNMLMQTSDDYYTKWIPASLVRLLGFIAAIISVFLPSIYISLVSYHQGLIPSSLAISLSKTREGVPFPSVIEAFLMEVTIEILRGAGARLPKPIGSTVSIVGAIVIGEAAVSAGIVSPMMVIVVSFTAICSFTIPNHELSLALRSIRFVMLFSAAFLGIYGVLIAIFFISVHLVRLRSFEIPYLEPFAPYYLKRWRDSLLRLNYKNKKDGRS